MDLTQKTYNDIAEDWMKDHQSDTWWIDGTNTFVSLLPSGASVLDVGCAGGVKSSYLSRKGLKIVGIDYSEKMVDIAKRRVPEAEFHVSDMRDVPRSLGEFDGIFIQAALLHIPKNEVLATLRHLENFLKPGGYVYIAVKEHKQEGYDEEVVTEKKYGKVYQRFFSYFTMDELKRYLCNLKINIYHELSEMSGKTCWLQVIGQKKIE